MDQPVLHNIYDEHKQPVNAVACHSTMRQFVSGCADGQVMVWSSRKHLRAFHFTGHQSAVLGLATSSQHRLIASASKDGTIRLWQPTAAGQSSVLKVHTAAVRAVDFSSDGHHMISCSNDKTIKVWSVATQRFAHSLVGHSHWVRSCGYSPHSPNMVVSGGDDRTVRVWDVRTRSCVYRMEDVEGAPLAVAAHPHEHYIASGGTDKAVKLWDMKSQRLIQYYPAHTQPVSSLAFHPTGRLLLSCGDVTTKVFDLVHGQPLYTLYGHQGSVRSVAVDPMGSEFVTGGRDGQVLVWHMEAGNRGGWEDPGDGGGIRGPISWPQPHAPAPPPPCTMHKPTQPPATRSSAPAAQRGSGGGGGRATTTKAAAARALLPAMQHSQDIPAHIATEQTHPHCEGIPPPPPPPPQQQQELDTHVLARVEGQLQALVHTIGMLQLRVEALEGPRVGNERGGM